MLTPSRLAIDVYVVCPKTLYLINQNTAQINNLGLPWYLNIIMQFLKMVSAIKKKKNYSHIAQSMYKLKLRTKLWETYVNYMQNHAHQVLNSKRYNVIWNDKRKRDVNY